MAPKMHAISNSKTYSMANQEVPLLTTPSISKIVTTAGFTPPTLYEKLNQNIITFWQQTD